MANNIDKSSEGSSYRRITALEKQIEELRTENQRLRSVVDEYENRRMTDPFRRMVSDVFGKDVYSEDLADICRDAELKTLRESIVNLARFIDKPPIPDNGGLSLDDEKMDFDEEMSLQSNLSPENHARLILHANILYSSESDYYLCRSCSWRRMTPPPFLQSSTTIEERIRHYETSHTELLDHLTKLDDEQLEQWAAQMRVSDTRVNEQND